MMLFAGISTLVGCVGDSEPSAMEAGSAIQDSESPDSLGAGGFLFAGTNAAKNGVAAYRRFGDGRLEFLGITLTGGAGTDAKIVPDLAATGTDPLVSQHSVALNAAHDVLVVVNAGDDTVTSFRVGSHGNLQIASRVSSGGHLPNTIAIRGNLVYVGNAGHAAAGVASNVVGFRISGDGALRRIPGAVGTFADPGAETAHVLFTPDGTRLVVTEVFTAKIDVFPVHPDGTLGTAVVNPSSGGAPFGMAFAPNNSLLVSEAEGAVADAATVSSYHMTGTHLTPVTAALPSGESGACWFSVTPDGKFAYATNTGSPDRPSSISIYAVSASGALTFLDKAAVPRPALPGIDSSGGTDSLITADGRFLYQEYSGLGVVGAFRINRDGSLTQVPHGDAGGMPVLGTEGLDGF